MIFFFLYATLYWFLITGANYLSVVSFEDNPLLHQRMLSAFVFEITGQWKWGIINLLPQTSLQFIILLDFLIHYYSSWNKWALGRTLHPNPSVKGELSYNSEACRLINVGRVVLWIWGELS